ncbi:Ig-like domain-containing protein, partial [Bacillus sp. SM2101]|uniref:Ig-like domain-containing protein n=1 Tax=Bacillus sp. SM2101 TaxID=2805366 RepID=UPI001BDF284E
MKVFSKKWINTKYLALFLVFFLAFFVDHSNAIAESEIGNDFIEFDVAPNTTNDTKAGRFTIGTTGGNPANDRDNNKKMLYGHEEGVPWSSMTSLNIDGVPFWFEADNSGTYDYANLSHSTVQTRGDISIQQVLSIVKNQNTNNDDTVEIKYLVTNNGNQSHEVGLRIMLDTMLGINDGAPFRIPGEGIVNTETEYTGDNIPEYWQAFDDIEEPTVITHGSVFNGTTFKPDKIQFIGWSRIRGKIWDYSILPGQDFSGNSSGEDSAVAIYWNPTTLAPGEVKEFKTFYGISELSQDLTPPLALSVTGASIVEATENGYSPNPFTVTAYITNIENYTERNARLNIVLPAGLKLAENQQQEISIGSINPGEETQVSWDVEIEPSADIRELEYVVNLLSDHDEKFVARTITIPPYEVIKNVEIEPENITLLRGTTHQLTVTATKDDDSVVDVTLGETGTTYSSDDTSIAMVDENGLVTIPENAPSGIAYIRAYHNGKTAVATIEVLDVTAESLIFTPDELTLAQGETSQLQVLANLSDNTQIDVTGSTTYSSADESLVTIDASGLITIPQNAPGGTVDITGSYEGISGTVTVTVPAAVQGITLDPSTVTLAQGETQQITVVANMSDGTTKDVTSEVAYSSDDASQATVDVTGLITVGVDATGGTVVITGSYEGHTSTTTVTVPATVQGITLDPSTVTLAQGETQQISVVANMSDGTTKDVTSEVAYSSDDASQAAVDVTGLITVPADATGGTVVITGSYEGHTSTTTVTVPATVQGITLDPSTVTLAQGETQQISVVANMSDGTTKDVTSEVAYSSDDASQAAVDVTGLITVPADATGGTVVIT